MMKNNKVKIQSENLIPENWIETTLGEAGKVITGKTPSTKEDSFWSGEIPFITPTDINKDSRYCISARTISEKGKKSLKNSIIPQNTICYTSIASIGLLCISKQESLTNQQINSLIVDENNDYLFFYYYLKFLTPSLKKIAGGTTTHIINKTQFENFPISLPPLSEQQAIASVLSAFDDKLELLREQNKALEEMGQVIFGEWFGKYGVDDELPDGWRVGKITEIIKRESVSYKCDKKDLDPKGTTPIIDQGSNGLYGYTSRNPDFIATKENPVILFTNHTCNYWFVDYPFCAIQNVLPYRGKDGYDEYFLYFMTKGSITFIEYKGHWPDFEVKDFIIPPVEIAQDFSKLAKPIFEKISDNNSQIQSLARSRDELLPRLTTGMLRVNDFSNN